mgnify:CR=1 FL=1
MHQQISYIYWSTFGKRYKAESWLQYWRFTQRSPNHNLCVLQICFLIRLIICIFSTIFTGILPLKLSIFLSFWKKKKINDHHSQWSESSDDDCRWSIYSGYLQINQSCNSAIFHHFVWNLSLTKHQGIDIDQITDRHKPCKNTVVK